MGPDLEPSAPISSTFPMVSLSPEPNLTEHVTDLAQNAAEFVPASELTDLGYPVSSPSEVELVGDLDSASAFLT